MTAALQTLNPQTSPDSPKCIYLPESAAGVLPLDTPVGQTTGRFGQAAAPASPTVAPVKKRVKTTNETCGQICTGSSESAGLTSFLVNKLKTRLGTDGSIVYKQTWKQKITPQGIVYWAHIASDRSTAASDYIGLPTPTTSNGGANHAAAATMQRGHGLNLEGAAQLMASWPTALANNAKGQQMMPGRQGGLSLQQAAQLAGYHTPVVRDARNQAGNGTNPRDLPRQVSGIIQSGSIAETTSTGQLSQHLSRWLMGYPEAFETCLSTYKDWQAWQDLMAQASVEQRATE